MSVAEQPGGRERIRALFGPVALVVAAAYALVAAATTPFSTAANVLTGLPIVLLAVLAVACWPLRPRPVGIATGAPHPWRAWVVLFAAVVLWELAEYAARGSRADHPTFSSMVDAVNRSYVLKALVFFLWLCLGAALVRLGRQREGSPVPSDPS